MARTKAEERARKEGSEPGVASDSEPTAAPNAEATTTATTTAIAVEATEVVLLVEYIHKIGVNAQEKRLLCPLNPIAAKTSKKTLPVGRQVECYFVPAHACKRADGSSGDITVDAGDAAASLTCTTTFGSPFVHSVRAMFDGATYTIDGTAWAQAWSMVQGRKRFSYAMCYDSPGWHLLECHEAMTNLDEWALEGGEPTRKGHYLRPCDDKQRALFQEFLQPGDRLYMRSAKETIFHYAAVASHVAIFQFDQQKNYFLLPKVECASVDDKYESFALREAAEKQRLDEAKSKVTADIAAPHAEADAEQVAVAAVPGVDAGGAVRPKRGTPGKAKAPAAAVQASPPAMTSPPPKTRGQVKEAGPTFAAYLPPTMSGFVPHPFVLRMHTPASTPGRGRGGVAQPTTVGPVLHHFGEANGVHWFTEMQGDVRSAPATSCVQTNVRCTKADVTVTGPQAGFEMWGLTSSDHTQLLSAVRSRNAGPTPTPAPTPKPKRVKEEDTATAAGVPAKKVAKKDSGAAPATNGKKSTPKPARSAVRAVEEAATPKLVFPGPVTPRTEGDQELTRVGRGLWTSTKHSQQQTDHALSDPSVRRRDIIARGAKYFTVMIDPKSRCFWTGEVAKMHCAVCEKSVAGEFTTLCACGRKWHRNCRAPCECPVASRRDVTLPEIANPVPRAALTSTTRSALAASPTYGTAPRRDGGGGTPVPPSAAPNTGESGGITDLLLTIEAARKQQGHATKPSSRPASPQPTGTGAIATASSDLFATIAAAQQQQKAMAADPK